MYSIQNLLGELTQVQLFMLLILYMDSVRRGLRKEAKDTLKLQIESEQMSKPLAIFLKSLLMASHFYSEMYFMFPPYRETLLSYKMSFICYHYVMM